MPAPAQAAVPAECASRQNVVSHADELAAIAAGWRRGRPLRIVAIGSSSTQGIGASSPDRAYPARLAAALDEKREGWTFSIANLGVGGETAPATLERLRAVIASDPDLVIWQVGTNDALRGGDPSGFRDLVVRGIAAARAADVGLMLLDPQDFSAVENRPSYEGYVAAIRAAADEYGVPLFSRYALMRDWRAASEASFRAMLSGDGFHMSDRGYECLAQHLADAIDVAMHRRKDFAPAMVSRERPVTSAGSVGRRRD